jgi:hypothetical protein
MSPLTLIAIAAGVALAALLAAAAAWITWQRDDVGDDLRRIRTVSSLLITFVVVIAGEMMLYLAWLEATAPS